MRDQQLPLEYARSSTEAHDAHNRATATIIAASICVAVGIVKMVAYLLLALQAAQTTPDAVGRMQAWSNKLFVGVALEALVAMLGIVWLVAAIRAATPARTQASGLDGARADGVFVVLELALLAYAPLIGVYGLPLWGSALCVVAFAVVAWVARERRSREEDSAVRFNPPPSAH